MGACQGKIVFAAAAVLIVVLFATGPAAATPPPHLFSFGSAGAGAGQLDGPAVPYMDRARNRLLVPNFGLAFGGPTGSSRVEAFARDGSAGATIGASGTGFGQLRQAAGVTADSDGNIYVPDYGNSRVQKFDANGNVIAAWGWGVATGAAQYEVCTAACQPGVAAGLPPVVPGAGQFYRPAGIGISPIDESIYVSDETTYIQHFAKDGTYLGRWGGHGFGSGEFRVPVGVLVDDLGSVYISEQDNNRVQKFTPTGGFLTRWGANGGDGTAGTRGGEFMLALGMTFTADGTLLVADALNNRIQEFTTDGTFIRTWGYGVVDGANVMQECTVAADCRAGVSVNGADPLATPLGVAVCGSEIYVPNNSMNVVDVFGSVEATVPCPVHKTATTPPANPLPAATKCVSRRAFRIHLRRKPRLVRASVSVSGKPVKARMGHKRRFVATIDLRKLPAGRFRVKLKGTTASGKRISGSRYYMTCREKPGRRANFPLKL